MELESILGPDHPSPSVTVQPTAVLAYWRVVRVGGFTDVLVGVRPGRWTWSMSTPIAFFLPADCSAITSSGRRYALQGQPSNREDDDGQVQLMMESRGVPDSVDVTETYWVAMQASMDYSIGRARVVANPRGYKHGENIENEQFQPALVAKVDDRGFDRRDLVTGDVETREVVATVFMVVPGFDLVKAADSAGHHYAITQITPGVRLAELREGQLLRLTVTVRLPRVLRAEPVN